MIGLNALPKRYFSIISNFFLLSRNAKLCPQKRTKMEGEERKVDDNFVRQKRSTVQGGKYRRAVIGLHVRFLKMLGQSDRNSRNMEKCETTEQFILMSIIMIPSSVIHGKHRNIVYLKGLHFPSNVAGNDIEKLR